MGLLVIEPEVNNLFSRLIFQNLRGYRPTVECGMHISWFPCNIEVKRTAMADIEQCHICEKPGEWHLNAFKNHSNCSEYNQ